jgi:hypothetical protein
MPFAVAFRVLAACSALCAVPLGALEIRGRSKAEEQKRIAVHLKTLAHAKSHAKSHSKALALGQTEAKTGAATQEKHVSEDVAFLMKLLDRFKIFAKQGESQVEARHQDELARMHEYIGKAKSDDAKLVMNEELSTSAESEIETKKIFKSITMFSDSLDQALGAAYNGSKGCADITCGPHATCTTTTLGGECVCDEGYIGNGQNCHAPEIFLPKKLLHDGGLDGLSAKVTEMHVAVFMGSKVVAVWRDMTNKNVGRVMLGHTTPGNIIFASPEKFSGGSKAFNPQVVGLPTNRIAIAYRDEDKEGACWLRGGEIGVSRVRGADLHISWGEPVSFCRNQAHKMAVVNLPRSRIAVFYSDHIPATARTEEEAFGNSVMADIDGNGGVSILGKFRWTDDAVLRLEATLLSPTQFVVACRASKSVNEMDTSDIMRQEAMAVYGEMDGADLLFDANHLNIEPEKEQVWARAVGLVGKNEFAYAYQMGEKRRTKLAVVKVDPDTHKMTVADGPVVLHKGFSPYVKMLNLAYAPGDPHTLVYYQPKNKDLINICRFKDGKITRCEDFPWVAQELSDVTAINLGGGRLLFMFANQQGIAYYQVMGLSKK